MLFDGDMCMIGTPEIDNSESKVSVELMLESSYCFAEECKRSCEDKNKINRVKRSKSNQFSKKSL